MPTRNILRRIFPAIVLLLPLGFSDCGGQVMVTGNIINVTPYSFKVTFNQWTYDLLPHSVVEIKFLSVERSSNARRDARKFDCCPCKVGSGFTIVPVTPGKTLLKDYLNKASWTVRSDKNDVSCDFEIHPTDVQ